jgi:predicted nuclease of restriction endonuclease-like (RecB) superfamily
MRFADVQERAFYEGQILRNGWSVRELEEHVRSDLFGRSAREGMNVLPPASATPVRPEDAFRRVFAFDVPGLPAGFDEEDLERALLTNFERMVAELGPDLSIRRSQQPLTIDGQLHRIDIELYHRGIPCLVIVDLKAAAFDDRDVGQMNKYVNYYRERVPQYP